MSLKAEYQNKRGSFTPGITGPCFLFFYIRKFFLKIVNLPFRLNWSEFYETGDFALLLRAKYKL